VKWLIITIVILCSLLFATEASKYFMPFPVAASNGRPINDATVGLYQSDTLRYAMTYLSNSAGEYYYGSQIAAGIYDIYVNGSKWREGIYIEFGQQIVTAEVSDSIAIYQDTTDMISETMPRGYLKQLSSSNSKGGGWFVQIDSNYTEDKFNYFDNAVPGKQWARLSSRMYASPYSPGDGLRIIGMGTNRAANIGFYSGDSVRWRIGGIGNSDDNDFYINRYDDAGNYIDSVFVIDRQTGRVSIGKKLRISDGDTTNVPFPSRFQSVIDTNRSSGNTVNSLIRANQTAATTGSVQGLESYVKTSHASGTVNLAIGIVGNIEPAMASGRTLSIARSIQAGGNLTDTGTVTSWAAYYAQPFANSGSGTITNGYGLYIDNFPSGVTNKYSIYQSDVTAENYFAGKLNINSGLEVRGGPAGGVVEKDDSGILIIDDGITSGFSAMIIDSDSRIQLDQYGITIGQGASGDSTFTVDSIAYTSSGGGHFKGGLKVDKDINVDGKITATGGVDPPYVSYSAETRESIVERSKKLKEDQVVMQFWNCKTKRFEVYVVKEKKFYSMNGRELR